MNANSDRKSRYILVGVAVVLCVLFIGAAAVYLRDRLPVKVDLQRRTIYVVLPYWN
jgi:hypothetical protein